MTDHGLEAQTHLEKAIAAGDAETGQGPWLHVAAAGVHALLHLSETIRHGLRDIVYELRD